jgi:hypothetical protein
MKTAAAYPRAIFFVSVAVVSVSSVLLSLIRLPNASEYHRQGLLDLEEPTSVVDHIQEDTLVDLRDARPEPGEPSEDAGLNKIAALPSYGTALKTSSIRSFH